MSQFSGPQGKGAMTVRRQVKRAEAEERNGRSNARLRDCGHVHGDTVMCEAVSS